LGARRCDLCRIEPHQRLTLFDPIAGGDVRYLVDEGIGACRDHCDAPFIKLYGAGHSHWTNYHLLGGNLRSDAGPLQFACRDFDSRTVVILARVV